MAEDSITASYRTNIDIAEDFMTSRLHQTRMWLKTTSLQANTITEDVITASLHENMGVADDMITASLHKIMDIAAEIIKAG